MGADNGPERADFSATVFVVTEKVGRTADWDALSSTALKLMTWKDLSDLNSKGIAIGSHSSSHKDLLTFIDRRSGSGERSGTRRTTRETRYRHKSDRVFVGQKQWRRARNPRRCG